MFLCFSSPTLFVTQYLLLKSRHWLYNYNILNDLSVTTASSFFLLFFFLRESERELLLKDYSNFLLTETHLRHRSCWISICYARDPCLDLTSKITWARYRVKLIISKDLGVCLKWPEKIGIWAHGRSTYSSVLWGLIIQFLQNRIKIWEGDQAIVSILI